MTKHWVEEMMDVEWFLVENLHKVIGDSGYPEIYYEAWISTSPHKDKAKSGYRIANLQRWFGPGLNGEIEQALGRHLVDAHNAFIKKPSRIETVTNPPQDVVEAVKDAKEEQQAADYQKYVVEAKPKRSSGWPKGVPRLYHPVTGKQMNLADTYKALDEKRQAEETAENQAASNGTVQQGHPVQTEDRQEPQEVQPQVQAPRKIPIMGTGDLG